MYICCCCSVATSYPALCDPMNCSTPGSSVHGIFQWSGVPSPSPQSHISPATFATEYITLSLQNQETREDSLV